jgi:hypothetical protein
MCWVRRSYFALTSNLVHLFVFLVAQKASKSFLFRRPGFCYVLVICSPLVLNFFLD